MTLLAILLSCLLGCKEERIEVQTTTDVNITGYLETHPEQFSDFLQILKMTGNAGFLNAYGAYTCFAPTNEAVALFMQKKGVASLEAINQDELKDLVRFHLLEDTLTSSSFTDGKLPKTTMYGQYLITGANNTGGNTQVQVNRQANILQSNIRVGNGFIHIIDQVLEPAKLSIAQLLEQRPDFKIFTQALKETGLYNTLNVTPSNSASTQKWYTVLAQSDDVFAKSGINSYEALKQRYSHTGDPKSPKDSLYLFIAYRILPEIKYLADMVIAPSHATMAPMEVVTSRLKGDTILVNEDEFNGMLEKGVSLDRANSDYSATNGVLHAVKGNFFIKVRRPVPIFWDPADQPELRINTANFRKPGKVLPLTMGLFKDITWEGSGKSNYITSAAASTDAYVYDDRLEFELRPSKIKWVELKTPMLVKGKYKIWVGLRRGAGQTIQTFFNDQPTQKLFSTTDYYLNGISDTEAEAQGYKRYANTTKNEYTARLVGTVEVTTTDRHRIKFVPITDNGGNSGNPLWLDQIHFIPVEADQLWPRFNRDGSRVERPE